MRTYIDAFVHTFILFTDVRMPIFRTLSTSLNAYAHIYIHVNEPRGRVCRWQIVACVVEPWVGGGYFQGTVAVLQNKRRNLGTSPYLEGLPGKPCRLSKYSVQQHI